VSTGGWAGSAPGRTPATKWRFAMPEVRVSALPALLATTAIAAEDVPFVVTPDRVTLQMLELAKVGKRDFVTDLGSGDGRIVIVAAKKFGARGLGVEIVPHLVRQSQ